MTVSELLHAAVLLHRQAKDNTKSDSLIRGFYKPGDKMPYFINRESAPLLSV